MNLNWKDSAFWKAAAFQALAIAGLVGLLTAGEVEGAKLSVEKIIAGVFALVAEALVLYGILKGTSEQPKQPPPSVLPAFFLVALGLWLLGSPLQAQQGSIPSMSSSGTYQQTCLFGRCQPRTDPALLALLQQIAEQNRQIIALLMQQQQGQRQQAPLIVYGQPPGFQQPYQQLPIQGQPKQDLPIAGQPKQDLPIQGQPKQEMPIQGQPKQVLPEQGQPLQELPGNAKPIPEPEGPPRLQELPTGYQQWNATRYVKKAAVYYPPRRQGGPSVTEEVFAPVQAVRK